MMQPPGDKNQERSEASLPPHTCHALECTVEIPPHLLMCKRHWMAVPVPLRRAVLITYRPGQERTKVTSVAWRQAAARAIMAVADTEGIAVPPIYYQMAAKREDS